MPHLSPEEYHLLESVLDRIVPADDFPGAVEAGVRDFIDGRFVEEPSLIQQYRTALMILEGRRFLALETSAQDAVIADLEGHPAISTIISHALEGYYAGIDSAGARMVGFRVTL